MAQSWPWGSQISDQRKKSDYVSYRMGSYRSDGPLNKVTETKNKQKQNKTKQKKKKKSVYFSLHSNCYYHVVYAKFKIKIYNMLPYKRKVWYFQKTNIDTIKKVINNFEVIKHFADIIVKVYYYLSRICQG